MELKFEEGMREISGFAAHGAPEYEEACRRMVVAGARWMLEHPEAHPRFQTFKDVMGFIEEDNKDAKELSKVMCDAAPNPSGAMMQATVSHVMWIRKHGWDAYVADMKKQKDEEWTKS